MSGIDFQTLSNLISNPTWDILVFLFFIAAGFFYGLSRGKRGLIATLFAIYVAQLIFINFSYLDYFIKGRSIIEIFIFRAALFFVFIAILSLLFAKIIPKSHDSEREWGSAFLLSFLEAGLLISSIFQLFPLKELFTFSYVTHYLFAQDGAYFWWLVLPIISLVFIVKKK